jgi:hypothetical protein
MKELISALIKAKGQFTQIKKDKVNPFHKSTYASLDSVLAAVEPALHSNSLMLSHSIEPGGLLITKLWHESGDFLGSTLALPELSDPQKLGSLITYYRRYAICALLSVTADEDDDANSNSVGNQAKPATVVRKPNLFEKELTELAAKLTPDTKIELLSNLGLSGKKKESWSDSDYKAMIAAIKDRSEVTA